MTMTMTMITPPVPPVGKGGKNKPVGASGAEDKSDLDKAAILEAFKKIHWLRKLLQSGAP